jgi:LmbE family N-acetylglucosaminyl deacetylase
MNSFLPSCLEQVLCLGAHADDIEIGCGGTLLRLVRRYPHAHFVWVTLSSDAERAAETRAAADRLLAGAPHRTLRVESFRGSYFPYGGAQIKNYFETLKSMAPDLIFTHSRDDFHQDHRIVNELTWNTFRNHAILEYEIPKYDGDLGRPNVFVPLTAEDLQTKTDILLDCFLSQRTRTWFTRSTFEALGRLRGVECNAAEGYAEAFYARKMLLAL